jgi:hypothetical protein
MYTKHREATFSDSPPEVKEARKTLAAAGFYFTGRGDVVKCAFCNGEIHKKKLGLEPMNYHRKFFPNCSYVKRKNHNLSKNKENEEVFSMAYQQHVRNENDLKMSSVLLERICSLKEENDRLRKAKTCISCTEEIVQVLFLPCRHISSCRKCSEKATNCAKCQSLIKGKIPIFLA